MSTRMTLTAAQKVAIIREHIIGKMPVSTLCDKYKISIVNFYNWQQVLFENAEVYFERKKNTANTKRQDTAATRKIEQREAKLHSKNEVIAELLQELVELKKNLGEP